MGRAGATCTLLIGTCAIYSCANILGIDDGTPRGEDDGSVKDATTIIVDGSFDAGTDVVDAAIDVPLSPIACGTSTCNALVEACCRVAQPTDASLGTFQCVADAADCKNALLITCDESANCDALGHAGDVCCANVPDGGALATSTSCIPAATCFGAFLCEPGDDEVCIEAGQSCQPSVQTIVGYDICKP